MGKVTFRFTAMVLLIIFGMLMGMNIAEKGIYKVEGNTDDPKSFQIAKDDNKVEVIVLGKNYTSEIPNDAGNINKVVKKEESVNPNNMKGKTNFISNLGNELGNSLQIVAEKGLKIIVNLME